MKVFDKLKWHFSYTNLKYPFVAHLFGHGYVYNIIFALPKSISCMLLLTLLQSCAPLFAQNRFVMYITHVHRYVCYVFHFVMYIISFFVLTRTISCMLLLTLFQHCVPSFAQNRFVMYITHVHRYICYVFHFVM
jgi:hypothetical protein